jgi:hypothetical protein
MAKGRSTLSFVRKKISFVSRFKCSCLPFRYCVSFSKIASIDLLDSVQSTQLSVSLKFSVMYVGLGISIMIA